MNCRVSNGPTCRASPDRDGRGKQTENCRVYCVSVTVYSWKMGIFLIMRGPRNSSWDISPVKAPGFLKWGGLKWRAKGNVGGPRNFNAYLETERESRTLADGVQGP